MISEFLDKRDVCCLCVGHLRSDHVMEVHLTAMGHLIRSQVCGYEGIMYAIQACSRRLLQIMQIYLIRRSKIKDT